LPERLLLDVHVDAGHVDIDLAVVIVVGDHEICADRGGDQHHRKYEAGDGAASAGLGVVDLSLDEIGNTPPGGVDTGHSHPAQPADPPEGNTPKNSKPLNPSEKHSEHSEPNDDPTDAESTARYEPGPEATARMPIGPEANHENRPGWRATVADKDSLSRRCQARDFSAGMP